MFEEIVSYYMACTYGELYDYLHEKYGIII